MLCLLQLTWISEIWMWVEIQQIKYASFQWSDLKQIIRPLSVQIWCENSFDLCVSLESVIFKSGSKLQRIFKYIFALFCSKEIVLFNFIPFIDDSAFNKLLLESLSISGNEYQIQIIDFFLDDICGWSIIRYPVKNETRY
jgi:hypothetical protein